jgi:hypothetical protein
MLYYRSAIIGIANYSIYMATIDYMICAYGPYSASATGGNGWSRDFLAGVLTIPATPFFQNIGDKPLQYASTILACIATLLVVAVYVIYWKGPVLRKRSPFAQQLSSARMDYEGGGSRRVSVVTGAYGSRRQSYATPNSRRGSLALPGSRSSSVVGKPTQEKARQRAAQANREMQDEETAHNEL